MARIKRRRSLHATKVHEARSHDLALNAQVAAIEVDDPLARLHSHHRIDEAQYRGGRAFQHDRERAERGPPVVDPTCEYVDGVQTCEPITEGQRQAALRLNRAERELGADGSALVHDVLVHGMTMEQIGQRRGLTTRRWKDFSRGASRNVSIGSR